MSRRPGAWGPSPPRHSPALVVAHPSSPSPPTPISPSPFLFLHLPFSAGDFGGHSNFHNFNLDLFWAEGFGIVSQLAGFEDSYFGNYLWLVKDGNYGGGQTCSGAGQTIVGNNTVWSPTGALTECGTSLANWQSQGNDLGTTGSPFPADSVVLGIARQILGLGDFPRKANLAVAQA